MADIKLSVLGGAPATSLAVGDLIPFTSAPGGVPVSKNITRENLAVDLLSTMNVSLTDLKTFGAGTVIADDASFSLPALSVGGIGVVVVGSDEARAIFSVDGSGNVYLWSSSDNVVANADTDDKLCIGTGVANPVVVKNRLAGAKAVMVIFWYN